MKVGVGASTLVLAAFAMGGAAFAADIPVAAQSPVYTKAPPPVICPAYWSAFGGWNSVSNMYIPAQPGTSGNDRTLRFKDGYVLGGAVGRCLPQWTWLRVEGEVAYRRNKLSRVTVAGEGAASRSGRLTSLSLMANAWADFPLAPNVSLHAGGGVGLARIGLKGDVCGPTCGGGAFMRVNDNDWVFAYQLGAGAAWHMTPTTSLTLDYRFFHALDPKFNGTSNFGPGTFSFKDDYKAHSIMVGIRSAFATGQ